MTMIYPYPTVKDEYATIAECVAGKNLARFGDGELKLMHGGSAMREPPNERLGSELKNVLRRPHPNCIVGIPTMDPEGPKYQNWRKHATRFCMILNGDMQYYSAFVSRPDSAPRIENSMYARCIEQLWLGKKAVVVCEPSGFMLRTVSKSAAETIHIECPKFEAYAEIVRLEKAVMRAKAEIAILSAGPAATCLANRLAGHGIHAVDLGSAGRFLYRNLWPEEYAQNFASDKQKSFRAPGT